MSLKLDNDIVGYIADLHYKSLFIVQKMTWTKSYMKPAV